MARPVDLLLLPLLAASAAGSALTRRALLVRAAPAAALGPGAGALGPAPAAAARPAVEALSIDAAVRLVAADGDAAWLAGVRGGGGGLLYRGVAGAAAAATARREAPDLLDASTYGSEAAAAYFKGVDGALAARGAAARPSVGHLCVADAKAAGAWGAAASVWPLGPAHYAWLPGSPTFWPAGGPPERAAADARLDEGLGDAIREGREVLFSCESNRFVAVPLALEGELRAGLDLLACKLTLGLG